MSYREKYLNGKRNGKGKEYQGLCNNIVFDGAYLNGERHGNGKEYYWLINDRFLIYEGGYLNGESNGKGKEYDIKGNIIFEGEYLNLKKWEGKIQYAK